MSENRRQFIKRSGLLLGGAATLPDAAAAPAARMTPNASSRLTAFLTRCRAKAVHLTGGSVLGTRLQPACTAMTALVTNPAAAFAGATGDMPFSKAHAAGDSLLLEDGADFFQIAFVTPAEWPVRRARMTAGEGIRFAHQSLSRERTLTKTSAPAVDPFGVMAPGGRTLRTVGTIGEAPLLRLRTVLEGIAESRLYDLSPTAEFTALRSAVLQRLPADDAEARSIVNEITAATAQIAAHCGNAEMSALLNAPLISAATQRVFGRSGAQIVNTATAIPCHSATLPGAPWLAAIIGPENLTITQGSVSIEHEDRFASIQSRSALLQARSLTLSQS